MIRYPLFAVAFGILGLAPSHAAVPPSRLTFRAAFDGVAPDGQHCVWEGSVAGASRGHLRLELRQVEEAAAAAHPVWHVNTHWSVRDADSVRSFTADLEGMIDWKAGAVRLAGVIANGWAKGAWVEVDGRVDAGDLTGVVTIFPALARR
jgi:hypothetical protein